jgi:hypothetical protein
MSPSYSQPPNAVPKIGMIIEVGPDDVRYRDRPLKMRIDEFLPEISQWYDGEWVWVNGYELNDADVPIAWVQALVRTNLFTYG